jgi:hypothetical protein
MVVYIPIYYCIMKLEQIWTNILVIRVHFHFATTLSQCCNCTKGLWKIRFNGILSMKFCTCKKTTMKKNFFHNSQFFFKLWNSYKMFLKHLLIHYDVITWIFLCFKVVKCSSIEDVDGLNVFFTILNQNNGFSNLIKIGNLF